MKRGFFRYRLRLVFRRMELKSDWLEGEEVKRRKVRRKMAGDKLGNLNCSLLLLAAIFKR